MYAKFFNAVLFLAGSTCGKTGRTRKNAVRAEAKRSSFYAPMPRLGVTVVVLPQTGLFQFPGGLQQNVAKTWRKLTKVAKDLSGPSDRI